MFDLEKSIEEWRREMRKRDLGNGRIEELERHLRDSFSQATANGHPPEAAWKEAIAEFGNSDAVAKEFSKLDDHRRPNRFIVTIIMVALFGFIIFGGLADRIIPFTDQVSLLVTMQRVYESFTFGMVLDQVNACVFAALVLVGIYLFAPRRKYRLMICCVAAIYPLVWMRYGFSQFSERLAENAPAAYSSLPIFYISPIFIPRLFFYGQIPSGIFSNGLHLFLANSLWHWTWLVLIFQEAGLKKWVLKLIHLIRLVPWTRKYYLIRRKV